MRIMPQFFKSFISIRGNLYMSNLGYDMNVDYIVDDLYHLPCFGPSSPENFPLIFSSTFRAWNEAYGKKMLYIYFSIVIVNSSFILFSLKITPI
jgi:hypothetical protein